MGKRGTNPPAPDQSVERRIPERFSGFRRLGRVLGP